MAGMPTFGSWGGQFPQGLQNARINKRNVEWIVGNPIAQYGEEFFANLQKKQLMPTPRERAQLAVERGFGIVKPLNKDRVNNFLKMRQKGNIKGMI